jgi:hypothetical protein
MAYHTTGINVSLLCTRGCGVALDEAVLFCVFRT